MGPHETGVAHFLGAQEEKQTWDKDVVAQEISREDVSACLSPVLSLMEKWGQTGASLDAYLPSGWHSSDARDHVSNMAEGEHRRVMLSYYFYMCVMVCTCVRAQWVNIKSVVHGVGNEETPRLKARTKSCKETQLNEAWESGVSRWWILGLSSLRVEGTAGHASALLTSLHEFVKSRSKALGNVAPPLKGTSHCLLLVILTGHLTVSR